MIEECSICLHKESECGHKFCYKKIKCGHTFHTCCINKYNNYESLQLKDATCPLCRNINSYKP